MAFFKIGLCLAAIGLASAAPQLSLGDEPEYLDAHPAYTYSYQVSDDAEQTYIAKEESRDGDDTVGKYQYVDATGALIRVEYRAGIDGYTEERTVEPNFVVVRARPATTVVSTPAVVSAPVRRVVTTQTTSARDDTDLVSRIIAQLTPFIQRTVSDSLSSSTTRRVQQAQPAVQAVRRVVTTTTNAAPAPVTATTQIFGNGGANNIRFENPDINYAFDF